MNPYFNNMQSPWSDPLPGEWAPYYETWQRPHAGPMRPPQMEQQQMPMPMPMQGFPGMYPMFPQMFPIMPPMFPPMFPPFQQQRQQWADPFDSDSGYGSSSTSSSGRGSPAEVPGSVAPGDGAADDEPEVESPPGSARG